MAAAVAEGAAGGVGCLGSVLSSWRYVPPTVGAVASVALPIIIGISAGVGSALYAGIAFGGAGFVASCFGFDAAYKANAIAALKAAEAAAKQSEETALKEVVAAKEEADELKKTNEALTGELTALKADEQQLEGDEKVLQQENSSLKQQVDALGAQITELQQENQTMKTNLDQLSAVRDTLIKENTTMKADLEQLTAMKTKLEGDVKELTDQTQILKANLNDFTDENRKLAGLLNRYDTKLGASTAVVEQAAALLKDVQGANLEQLAPQIQAAAVAAADLKKTLTETRIEDSQRQAQLVDQLHQSEAKLLQVNASVAKLQEDEVTLQQRVDQLTAVKDKLEKDEQMLQSQIEQLRGQIAAETKEHNDFMLKLKAEMAVVQERLDQKKSGAASGAGSPATSRKVLPQPPAAGAKVSDTKPADEHAGTMV